MYNVKARTRKDENSGCLLWTGPLNKDGYGNASGTGAHRRSWENEKGPIPKGLYVLHKCDVRHCVNPEHLYLGTQIHNMKDMVERGRSPVNMIGSANNKTHLTDDDVRVIRASTDSVHKLAKQYNISKSAVQNICYRTSWKHVV